MAALGLKRCKEADFESLFTYLHIYMALFHNIVCIIYIVELCWAVNSSWRHRFSSSWENPTRTSGSGFPHPVKTKMAQKPLNSN